jgi:lysozyme family protein
VQIDRILEDILRREGGYVNNPADKGGPTKYGITQATLAGQGRWGDLNADGRVDQEDVKLLTVDQAKSIYLNQYITPFDEYLTWPKLHSLIVDSAVQHGVARVQNWLKELTIKTTDPIVLYKLLLKKRMRFYGEIITKRPQNAEFAAGWMIRLSEFVE